MFQLLRRPYTKDSISAPLTEIQQLGDCPTSPSSWRKRRISYLCRWISKENKIQYIYQSCNAFEWYTVGYSTFLVFSWFTHSPFFLICSHVTENAVVNTRSSVQDGKVGCNTGQFKVAKRAEVYKIQHENSVRYENEITKYFNSLILSLQWDKAQCYWSLDSNFLLFLTLYFRLSVLYPIQYRQIIDSVLRPLRR